MKGVFCIRFLLLFFVFDNIQLSLCYCVVVLFRYSLLLFRWIDAICSSRFCSFSILFVVCAVWWMVDGESDLVVWEWNRTKGKHKLLFMRCQNAYWKLSYYFWVDRLILMGMTIARAQPPNHPTIQAKKGDIDTIQRRKTWIRKIKCVNTIVLIT